MKIKRSLAVLVAVAMCLALFPSFAFAEGEKVSVLSAGGELTNYATLEEAMTNAESGATITLLDDVTTSGQITILGKTITLDLDGRVLKYGGTTQGSVLRLESGANLTLKDSNTKGLSHKFNTASTPWVLAEDNATGDNITTVNSGVLIGDNGSYGGGVYVEDSTFTMESGTIAGCKANYSSGGGVYVGRVSGSPKFDMKGGAILGCTAQSGGGGVYLQLNTWNPDWCQFNMSGGKISYCSTTTSSYGGGGLYINDGTFNMTGGEISNCTSTNFGGGVYAKNSYTKISIQGGNISNCTATNGGDGICKDGKGTLEISGGTIDGETDIRNFTDVTLSGGTFGTVTVADKDGRRCYSVLKDGYAFTSKNDSSVVSGDVLTVSDVKVAAHICQFESSGKCACGRPCKHSSFNNFGECNDCGMLGARIKIGETNYSDLQTAVDAAADGDIITLINNVSTASTVKIEKDKNITLDLNGHILKYQNSETRGALIQIDSGGTLTLKDSNTGTLTHKFNTENTPWVLVDDNATGDNIITVNGGVLIGDNGDYGGGVYVAGTFYMESGTIAGCDAWQNGGGVLVYGTFDMNGGAILGCTAMHGGSVCITNNGKFIFRNGTISNCDSTYGKSVDNGNITLVYGNNTISENNISNAGNKIVFLTDTDDTYATEYVKSGTVPVEPDDAPKSNGVTLDYWYYIDDTLGNKVFDWSNAISTDYTLYGMYKSAKITTQPTAVTNLVYNNSPLKLITQGMAEHGTMMYRIGETGEYTNQIPTATDMGEYTVYYYAKGEEDYNDSLVQSVNVRIAGLDMSAGVSASGYSGEYDNENHTISVTLSEDAEGATIMYGEAEGSYGLTDAPVYKDKGIYTVYYQVTKANYEPVTGSKTVKILAKDMSADVSASGYSGVYDNVEHTISVTLSKDAEGATIMYGTTEGTYDLNDAPAYKDIGIYTVYYQVTKANYKTVTGSRTVVILAKDITGAEIGSFEQITYNGTPQTPKATVTIDGLTVTGTWSDVTNVGDTSTFTANGNFTGTIENVNVGMKNKDMSAGVSASGYSGVYDNAEHTISVTLSKDAEGATIMYGTKEGTYDLAVAPTYKDKGTYIVYYQVTKANYEPVTGNATVEISPKDITDAEITLGDSLKYNGEKQTQTITSVTVDGLNVTYDVSGNVQKDAGEYTLTVTGNGNFTGSSTKAWSISASVEQAPNIQIDYANEVLKGFENANYTIDGSNVTLTDGKLAIADYIGKTISIVKKGNGTSIQDSAAQEIVIPPRPTAPKVDDFTVTQPSEVGGKGSISGITDTMEYSTNNGTEWTVGSGEDIGEIVGGTKYLVRYKATESSFKSENYEIEIIAFEDTSVKIVLTANSVKVLNANSGVLAVAGFDENGIMNKINFIDDYESELIGYENCYEIKAFLWNNLEGMIPICNNAYIKNSK